MVDMPIRFSTGGLSYRRTPSGRALVAAVDCTVLWDAQAERVLHDLDPMCARFQGRLAVEVSGVVNFSCAWLNALMELSERCAKAGGRLVVVGAHSEFTRVVRKTGLTRHIDIVRTEAEAMHRLGEPGFGPLTRVGRWLTVQLTRPITIGSAA